MRMLFVCGQYWPYPSANGVCVMRVQEALHKQGIESDVICLGTKNDSCTSSFGEIVSIESHDKVINNDPVLRIMQKIRLLRSWPIRNPKEIDLFANAIRNMDEKYQYDLIVSVLLPIEGAIACSYFDRVVLYELDSITNNGDNLHGVRHILRYRASRIEASCYKRAFRILHLKCHEHFYEDKKYDGIRNKSEYVDVPHLMANDTLYDESTNSITRIVFTGSMTKARNSPEYAIKLMKACSDYMRLECLFFSRGNCESLLSQAHNDNPKVFFQYGYISQEDLAVYKRQTDIFLSIGFCYAGTVTSIPSKIFEYMATGKPIIHIVGGRNDTAIAYLETYQNALIVDPEDSLEANVIKTIEFIKNNKGSRIDVNILRELFPMNTPEWTAGRLVEFAGIIKGE